MKLSRQAQLGIVGIWQKGILGVADAAELLRNVEFKFEGGELVITNPDTCQLSDTEIEFVRVMANSRPENA